MRNRVQQWGIGFPNSGLKNAFLSARRLCMGVLLAWVSVGGCKDPYLPEYEPGDTAPILIVEGFIDIHGPASVYTLGLARPVADGQSEGTNTPVTGGNIAIESEAGAIYHSQAGETAGAYIIAHPALPLNTQYRLRIRVGADEYLSDFVEPKQSPAITAVDWEVTPEGLQLYVSTEDPTNDSRYYRWEFEETWRFSAKYISQVLLENGEFRDRSTAERISICFQSDQSRDLLIGTTAGLAADVIHRHPIQLIAPSSEKLQYRYSILVKQRAISEEAFIYWDIIKKNSEDLGDIFSPLPSEIRGNLRHVSTASKRVVGMVEAAGLSEKRIFVDMTHLPGVWVAQSDFNNNCELFENTVENARDFLLSNPNYIPVFGDPRNPASPYPTHYTYAPRRCVDCTLRGTLDPPVFWED